MFNETRKEKREWKLPKNNVITSTVAIILSAVLSISLFFIFRQYVFDGIREFVWRDILSFSVAGMLMLGLKSATKKTVVSSGTIFWFMMVILTSTLVYDYTKVESDIPKEETKGYVSPKPFTTIDLKLGGNVFDLKEGESTPWLSFPNGINFNLEVFSSAKNYLAEPKFKVVINNGTNIYSNEQWPFLDHVDIRIIALEDQQIRVLVEER